MYEYIFYCKCPRLNLSGILINSICYTCRWENNEAQGVEALRKILLPTKCLYFSQIECLLVCLSKPRGGLGSNHPLKKA